MRCERARLQLSVALDESLTDDETAALRAHVAGCPGCAAQERVWRDVRRQLRVEVVGEMPNVAPRVLHAISTTTDTPRRPHRPRRSRRDCFLRKEVAFAPALSAGQERC